MKKYLVIGNPIDHSLSPLLHNYWIKKNKIEAIYEKKLITENEIEKIISLLKSKKLNGINVTVPFKKKVVSFMDSLTEEANETQSVAVTVPTDTSNSSTMNVEDDVNTGAVVSTTLTVLVAVPAFPEASVEVYVIV